MVRSAAWAFALTDLLIIVAVMALLAAVILPGLTKMNARSARINCSNGMKQICLATRTWSLDDGDRFPTQVSVNDGGTMELVARGAVWPHFQVMSNELGSPRILLCPNDASRNVT